MKKELISVVASAMLMNSCGNVSQQAASLSSDSPDVTVAVVSDLHFDMPPETDQYYLVKAVNRLGDSIHIDAVLQTGDIFDKAAPEIQALYKLRWEQGDGDRTIHYPTYPLYGNHDVSPANGRPNINKKGYELNMQYLDSLLQHRQAARDICGYDAESRAYSFNKGGVHFVMVTLAAGDTTYCKSNIEWLKADLETYCADGTPVVYCQHYGFDEWALDWWTPEQREQLFGVLRPYRLAAFLVGHTHQWSVQQYAGVPVVQVNNAWADGDGPISFCLLKIKGDDVTIETYNVLDEEGHIRRVALQLNQTVPINR